MAFKIVVFFIGFILLSFSVLYVYHRIKQQDVSEKDKQSFFDFLEGTMEGEHARHSIGTARYMF